MSGTTGKAQRAALYARVSTTGHGQDVGLQLDELRQVAAQRGWSVVEEFVDEGISGAKASRPALDRMMEERYEEIKTRHQQTTLGMTEQEELDLILLPLWGEEPAPAAYVDREVQDWIDDHPFYEWGEVV